MEKRKRKHRTDEGETGPKAGRAAFYDAGGGKILVLPTPGWWALHKVSQVTAVARRAGLRPNWLSSRLQKLKPELRWYGEWLRGDAPPPGMRPIYPNQRHRCGPDRFAPTAEDQAFREAASVSALERAAKGCYGASWSAARDAAVNAYVESGISRVEIVGDETRGRVGWKAPKRRSWLWDWMLRGEPAPNNVVILSAAEVVACRKALAYRRLYRDATGGLDGSYSRRWMAGALPAATTDELLAWLRWLWGQEHAVPGWLLVSEPMERVRQQASDEFVARQAGISKDAIYLWRRNKAHSHALDVAVAAAEPSMIARTEAEKEKQLAAVMAAGELAKFPAPLPQNMALFALESRPAAVCKRAKVTPHARRQFLADAEKLGCGDDALRYVRAEATAKSGRRFRDGGAVGPCLFVPTAEMRKFRSAARAATRKLPWEKPGFERLFLDLVVPAKCTYREIFAPRAVAAIGTARAVRDVGADRAALEAALARCRSPEDREVVNAVVELCAERTEPYVVGKIIAKRLGKQKGDGPVPARLKKRLGFLVNASALETGPGNTGYRLTTTRANP